MGKLDGWEAMKPGIPADVKCFSYPYGNKGYEDWTDLCAKNEPLKDEVQRNYEEVATIIYTSGTTGWPKGVVHSFEGVSFAAQNALKVIPLSGKDQFFSYLPLAHVAERVLVEIGCLYSNGVVSFIESKERFMENLKEIQPTVFLAVPFVWSTIVKKVTLK